MSHLKCECVAPDHLKCKCLAPDHLKCDYIAKGHLKCVCVALTDLKCEYVAPGHLICECVASGHLCRAIYNVNALRRVTCTCLSRRMSIDRAGRHEDALHQICLLAPNMKYASRRQISDYRRKLTAGLVTLNTTRLYCIEQ